MNKIVLNFSKPCTECSYFVPYEDHTFHKIETGFDEYIREGTIEFGCKHYSVCRFVEKGGNQTNA